MPDERTTTLFRLRIVWMVTVLLILALLALGVALAPSVAAARRPDLARPLQAAGLIVFFLLAIAGYVARLQLYKRHWRAHVIAPAGYLAGNVVLFGLLQVPAVLAFIGALVTGNRMPMLVPAGLAVVLCVLNYPSGAPMEPAEPELLQRR